MPDYRILRPIGNRRYPTKFATTYAVETEPGIFASVTRLQDQSHISRPPRGSNQAILYVSHHSADAELARRTTGARIAYWRKPESRCSPAMCAASAIRGRTPAAWISS